MKNIYLIPTKIDEGRLFMDSIDNKLVVKSYNSNIVFKDCEYYNLYITSDEEVKEGDWFIHKTNADLSLHKCIDRPSKLAVVGDNNIGYLIRYCKKIILTTDLDLTKDDIQGINNDFLEWFVKNPSCEYVEIEDCRELVRQLNFDYRIKIPREETLEEAAENVKEKSFMCCGLSKSIDYVTVGEREKAAFINGGKWQAERMYNEEEVLKLLIDCKNRFGGSGLEDYVYDSEVKDWFNKNKKK